MILSISIGGSGLGSGGGSGSGCGGRSGEESCFASEFDLLAAKPLEELEEPALEDFAWNMAESVV